MPAALVVSIIGLILFVVRLAPVVFPRVRIRGKEFLTGLGIAPRAPSAGPLVSIIVPARDEESNLPRLFASLQGLQWADLEIIIVNDQSTDGTEQMSLEFKERNPALRVQLVNGQPRPEGWTGKNWACHQGVQAASGVYYLFTDADTWHEPFGLAHAVQRMEKERLDLLSAVPFHLSETLWERLTGPFQILLLFTTGAFSTPRPNRVFAIGQYLLFRAEWYRAQGGHQAVRARLCEDLELAAICLRQGGAYRVDSDERIFRVRMYASLRDFMNGWRRNFRLGLKHARFWAPAEIYLFVGAATAGGKFFWAEDSPVVLIMMICLFLLLIAQRRLGQFSVLGVILLPFSLALFIAVSVLATMDLLLQREYSWRGRAYKVTAD